MKGEIVKVKDNTNVNFVWDNFQKLFPEKVNHVISYERKGSKMIQLNMDDGLVLHFLYYSPVNWNYGTKPWRMKPKTLENDTEGIEVKE